MVELASRRRWVVKIGSSLLTDHGAGLQQQRLIDWCAQLHQLREQQIQVVLVSSGAVAVGTHRLGWRKPTSTLAKQVAAAVGQTGLIHAYESAFAQWQILCAQVLLTHADLADRNRYLNARSTMRELLAHGLLPIVNENDTLAVDEIRFGDNDRLAALVANLIDAERLVILTDQHALFDADPRTNPNAKPIIQACVEENWLRTVAGGANSSGVGSGGMYTKILAAELAAQSGADTVIVWGLEDQVLVRLAQNQALGTRLVPGNKSLSARKQWLFGQLRTKGQLQLDAGAVRILRDTGSSLLAVGVVAVQGTFQRGDAVMCIDSTGQRIAIGLINYSSADMRRICGQASQRIEAILGFISEPEIIHRDNLVIG